MDDMSTTTTKPMSYALRSLYPGAFASYQGTVFRVTSPSKGALAGVSMDMDLTMETMEKLTGEEDGRRLLEKARKKLIAQIQEDSKRTLPGLDKLRIIVPEKIDLRFDDSLSFVYCSDTACGTLNRLNYIKFPPKDRMPACPTCKKARVQQAPVWTPQKMNLKKTHALMGDPGATGIVRNLGVSQLFCYYSRPGDKCVHPSGDGKCVHAFDQKLGSLKMMDPQRPVDSLRRYNPHCPKGLVVPPERVQRLPRTGGFWFKMDFPRESMTVPLHVSAVEPYSMQNDTEVEEVNEVLADTKPVLLNPSLVELDNTKFTRLRVLEMVYGYRIGNRNNGVSSYYLDGQQNNVLGRLTETQGFMVSLKPSVYAKIDALKKDKNLPKETDYYVDIALHSIKHALLVLAPMFTGFDPDKFHGSYDALGSDRGGKIYVYDTDEGGNGGFAALIKSRESFIKMLKEISVRLTCPTRECLAACKQCLFIKNCGNINRGLNRHLVEELNIFYNN